MKRSFAIAVGLMLAACGGGSAQPPPAPAATVTPVTFPTAPAAPDGANDAATARFDDIVATIEAGSFDVRDVQEFIDAGDTRHAWLLTDLLRFLRDEVAVNVVVRGFDTLTGVDITASPEARRSPWNVATNHLLAWDTPAPPDYQRLKGDLFTLIEARWAPFFDDDDATLDWRWLSWGGVFIDDRPLGDPDPCGAPGCIPSLDDPTLVSAAEGDWYDDEAIVFGVTEGDESVAFPKNIMQIHEMVNITIGGRRFGIPYCTLCGSAQAFYIDDVPVDVDELVLRTSGLLSRSNKVMYDLTTNSVFDTFTGEAVTGPLQDAGVVLDQNSVTVSTWGEWKAARPDTAIVAQDGGIGRTYDDDPLEGRDDNGPIFPIGDTDPRLPVQAPVLGVLLENGDTIAFSVDALRTATAGGDAVTYEDITVTADGGGFIAEFDGDEVGTHEAFWFAWHQFHPETLLWPNDAVT